MRKRLITWLTMALVLCVGTGTWIFASADANDNGGYTEKDKEYYLTESQIAFIRPGLEMEILDVTLPEDRLLEVTFKLTDPAGLPLDREGVFTPGPVSTSFILSYIPTGESAYVAYTTRVQTSPITGDSAVQATSDSGGSFTVVEDGVYTYKFGTEVPEDFDADATHTMGVYARRDLTEFDLDRYVVNKLEHFVPSGNGMPVPRDIVTTATCNRCHDPLALHGGARTEVGLCVLCHNATQDIDPDTGSSIYMPNMVHKIHAGENLANGYTVIGYRQSVHDYSDVVFPPAINDCEVCHTGGTPTGDFPMVASPSPAPSCDASGRSMTKLTWEADVPVEVRIDAPDGKLFASSNGSGEKETGNWVVDGRRFFLVKKSDGELLQELEVSTTVFGCVTNAPGTFRGEAATMHTAWLTNPSRVACGSCHDQVNFETGEGHVGGSQEDDEFCSFCHQADSGNEFDSSVRGAHVPVYKSKQIGGGLLVTILGVNNTGPGQSPSVIFSLTDNKGKVNPAMLGRLRFTLTGPNEDFDFYVQENASNLQQVGENWRFTFSAKVPADAEGSYSVGVEGRMDTVVKAGNEEIETEKQIRNYVVPVAVTDAAPVARRVVVDDAKCESCHSNLSLHGDNRRNATEYCQTCHRPDQTDNAVRPAGTGPDQSIHFKYMVHKIHRGAELENGFLVFGYRSSIHDFSDLEFVGDLRNCEACHVNDSYNLGLPDTVLPTFTPADFLNPTEPEAAACLSCHDSFEASSHAAANTGAIGESCSVCHGPDKSFSVNRVHAR
ncbi:MAG: OmcA/MtrC family decaheme c-type cytochrome [Xanthomonadales bacterium]|nr:OmcA/MtrC family decaheme c-type cytochrome [Xanthomonadales bacterium]